jgi:hypothetical protein
LRPGGRLPNGFLFPANFANVLVGLPVNGLSDFENDFFAPNPPLFFPPNPPGLPPALPATPPALPAGFPANFRGAKSPDLRASPSPRAGRSEA